MTENGAVVVQTIDAAKTTVRQFFEDNEWIQVEFDPPPFKRMSGEMFVSVEAELGVGIHCRGPDDGKVQTHCLFYLGGQRYVLCVLQTTDDALDELLQQVETTAAQFPPTAGDIELLKNAMTADEPEARD